MLIRFLSLFFFRIFLCSFGLQILLSTRLPLPLSGGKVQGDDTFYILCCRSIGKRAFHAHTTFIVSRVIQRFHLIFDENRFSLTCLATTVLSAPENAPCVWHHPRYSLHAEHLKTFHITRAALISTPHQNLPNN